jgi:hypothetical protein
VRCNGRDQQSRRWQPPIQPRRASARSAAASSGGGRRSTQAGEYAPEARPTSRQHQLQPPKQAAPALHSARSAHWIYVKTFMTGLAIYRPSSSKICPTRRPGAPRRALTAESLTHCQLRGHVRDAAASARGGCEWGPVDTRLT